jgi:phytoene dehydrogenase-like protein
VPWKAKRCTEAATVHLGASFADIETSEYLVKSGQHPEVPFVILVQPSLFDSSRAPNGRHTLWAYCHVPNGSTFDMSERIEQQIERFAPGFRDCVLVRKAMNTVELEKKNANLVGGDINGGSQDLIQMFKRPTFRYYRTSRRDLYLCSSATPPGGGVHGMCGFHAARAALRYGF